MLFPPHARTSRPAAQPRFCVGWLLVTGGFILLLLMIGLGMLVWSFSQVQKNLNQKQPDYTAADYYQKAVEQVDKADFNQAEKYLELALKKENSSDTRHQLAVVKYQLKKYQESISTYASLIAEKKELAFAWNGTGNAYRDWAEAEEAAKNGTPQQHFEQAEQAYRSAIAADSQYVAAYSNLALLLSSQGKGEEAKQLLEQGYALTKNEVLATLKQNLSNPIAH